MEADVTEPDDTADVIRRGYDAFNRRDIEGALAAMTDDVEWANGWEGGHAVGREAVGDYWTRQWQQLDPTVTPTTITTVDDTVTVVVDQLVRDVSGRVVSAGTVQHVYTVRDGLIARMDIVPLEAD